MELWYPPAIRNEAVRDSGSFSSGAPSRGVLHTTESHSFTPRPDSYGGWHTSYPHFTAIERSSGFEIYQHIPLNRAARALRNPAGGVQTNRHGAIQIEIVGKASESPSMSNRLLTGLAAWMRWVEKQTGIQQVSPTFDGSAAYGVNGSARMAASVWNSFNGWCGHQHVPENDHWDPGRIPIDKLLAGGAEPDPVVPAPEPVQSARYRVIEVEPGDVLNVRNGPGVANSVVGSLAGDETRVMATGQSSLQGSSTWFELSAPIDGWVNSRYLEAVEVRASIQTTHRVTGVADDDQLNVRRSPGLEAPVVGQLEPGETNVTPSGAVIVVGVAEWYELAEPLAGWCNSRYLERSAGTTRRGPIDQPTVIVPEVDQYTHGDVGEDT